MVGRIKNFFDLNAWKEAHKLVLAIYELVEEFPRKEQFVLSSQILRASISITSNLAEGFGRKGIGEKIQFYYLGHASLTEVQNQLMIAKDVGYIESKKFERLWKQTVLVQKLMSGLIRSLKSK